MKLKNNLILVATLAMGLSLEFGLLSLFWMLRDSDPASTFAGARFLLLGQVFVLGSCALAYLASRHVLRPVEDIVEGIADFGQGKFELRIPKHGVREFDLVADRLNSMASKLQELDSLRSGFLANVSHELRSPLAAMEQYLGLLLEETSIAGQSRENLLRIRNNLSRLRHLVENLLEMSKIEADKLELHPEVFDPAAEIEEACALLSVKMKARGLALNLELDKSIGALSLDRGKLRQILVNLLDNAVKYNRDAGSVSVSSSARDGSLVITVEDTGWGIPSENMDALFERFRRLPPGSAEAPRTSGVGLGLAISRGLARAMGGDLTAQSEPGKGSAFTCSLPLKRKTNGQA